MLLFKGKKFNSWLDLYYYLAREQQEEMNEKFFPHNIYFYAKAAIKANLGIDISIYKIRQLIKQELALKTITLKEKEVSQSNVSC